MVVFVVKRYAVRETEKWRYAVRKAKIGRYAVRKGGGVCHPQISIDFLIANTGLGVDKKDDLHISLQSKGYGITYFNHYTSNAIVYVMAHWFVNRMRQPRI